MGRRKRKLSRSRRGSILRIEDWKRGNVGGEDITKIKLQSFYFVPIHEKFI
jgi:hypothetical protein